jgi:3-phytase
MKTQAPSGPLRLPTLLIVATLLAACSGGINYEGEVVPVAASLETTPVESADDAADDPAIWRNPAAPRQSLVLGTDKQRGLAVYDLAGALQQFIAVGLINNVDLRSTDGGAIAVASHDGRNVVALFSVDGSTGSVHYSGEFPTGHEEPYGICIGRAASALLVAVTYKDGLVQLFDIADSDYPVGGVTTFTEALPLAAPPLWRTLQLDSQLEGCVFDDDEQRLFIGEENAGLWSVTLTSREAAPTLVAKLDDGSGLVADVEGVSLWAGAGGQGWLLVSAQGANQFVVMDRQPPHGTRGVFSVALPAEEGNDPVRETDGLDVIAAPLGAAYPRGLLVVQDGENRSPDAHQNFKFIDWRAVETALGLPVVPLAN